MSQSRPIPVPRCEERLFFDKAPPPAAHLPDLCGLRRPNPVSARTMPPVSGDHSERHHLKRPRHHLLVHNALSGRPRVTEDVPYTVALVDLDEGIRIPGDLVGVAPTEVRIAMPVQVAFTDLSATMTVPCFTAHPTEA